MDMAGNLNSGTLHKLALPYNNLIIWPQPSRVPWSGSININDKLEKIMSEKPEVVKPPRVFHGDLSRVWSEHCVFLLRETWHIVIIPHFLVGATTQYMNNEYWKILHHSCWVLSAPLLYGPIMQKCILQYSPPRLAPLLLASAVPPTRFWWQKVELRVIAWRQWNWIKLSV